MKVRVTLETEDGFEKGCCYECPFAILQLDEYNDYDYQCPFYWDYDKCKLEVINEIKESN